MTTTGESVRTTTQQSQRSKPRPEQTGKRSWILHSTCPDCGGEIKLPINEEPQERHIRWAGIIHCNTCADRAQANEERRHEQGELEERIRKSGLPHDLRGLTFDDVEEGDIKRNLAINAAMVWAQQEQPRGLYLHGPVGIGKTYLAAVSANERLRKYPVQWVSVAQVLMKLQAAFSDNDRKVALKTLYGSTPIVLDDIDKIPAGKQTQAALFTAIDERIVNGSPLLVTANVRLSGLAEKLGDPIASRIAGYCKIHELIGRDRRLV